MFHEFFRDLGSPKLSYLHYIVTKVSLDIHIQGQTGEKFKNHAGGVNGPGLEVAHAISVHTALARTQSCGHDKREWKMCPGEERQIGSGHSFQPSCMHFVSFLDLLHEPEPPVQCYLEVVMASL